MHGAEEFQDHSEQEDYPKLEFTNYEKGVQQLDRSLENQGLLEEVKHHPMYLGTHHFLYQHEIGCQANDYPMFQLK